MRNRLALARTIVRQALIEDLPMAFRHRHPFFIRDRKPKSLGNLKALALREA
jgi:hypothetical protein